MNDKVLKMKQISKKLQEEIISKLVTEKVIFSTQVFCISLILVKIIDSFFPFGIYNERPYYIYLFLTILVIVQQCFINDIKSELSKISKDVKINPERVQSIIQRLLDRKEEVKKLSKEELVSSFLYLYNIIYNERISFKQELKYARIIDNIINKICSDKFFEYVNKIGGRTPD